jgi:oligosaccharide repeat unit polymerase
MGTELFAGLLLVLVLVNYRLSRSILYPPFVFCMMWLLDLSLYSLHLVDMDLVRAETLIIITLGAILFSLGGAVALTLPQALIRKRLVLVRHKHDGVTYLPQTKWIKYCVIVLLAIGGCFIVHNTFIAAAGGSGGSFLARARSSGLDSGGPDESEQHSSILPYINLWSIYFSVLFQIERRDRLFWSMAGITFVVAIFGTNRTDLLLLISGLTGAYLIKTNRLSFRSALAFVKWPVMGFMTLWGVLIFTNKDTSGFGRNVGAILAQFLVGYLVGPLVGLDHMLRHPADYAGVPDHTFKFFLSVAASLHLIQYTPPPMFESFVFVPFPTNVYTVYRFYIGDFGLYGALGLMFVIGGLHTLVYRKARTGSDLSILFFSLTLYPIIMVIFDDQYSAFGSYLDVLMVGSLYMFLRSQPMLRFPEIKARRQL